MLVRFTVENFMSFKEPAELSMLASKVQLHSEHVIRPEKSTGLRVLKSSVVYGANASGKSNLIKALHHAKQLITVGEVAGKNLPYSPFKLDKQTNNQPSRFEFEIKYGERYYAYGFLMNQKRILEEWLYEISRTKEKLIFERTYTAQKTEFNLEGLKTKTDSDRQFLNFIGRGTPENRLFLRECFERNVFKDLEYLTALSDVYEWFDDKLIILFPNSKYSGLEMDLHSDDLNMTTLSTMLSHFDTGIANLNLQQIDFRNEAPEIPEDVKQEIIKSLEEREAALVSGPRGVRYRVFLTDEGEVSAHKLMTCHIDSDGDEVLFELNQESDGTQRLLDIAPGLLDLLTQDKVYVIDELDRSLHTEITTSLMSTFLKLTANKPSQLIVTTHESNLLNLDLMRRDEIWFTQKNKSGQSKLYSLEEFKARFDKDIRKDYLVGRFGGVPVVKGLLEELLANAKS